MMAVHLHPGHDDGSPGVRAGSWRRDEAGGGSSDGGSAEGAAGGRLNLLLSHAGWEPDPWVDALPVLLEPIGVRSIRVHSGSEASRLIRQMPIHVAVVDLAMPLSSDRRQSTEGSGGERLLDLLTRLAEPPPTIAVRGPRAARDEHRELTAALRAGVFAVIDRPRGPHDIDTLLRVLRRVLERVYGDAWPVSGGGSGSCSGAGEDVRQRGGDPGPVGPPEVADQ